MERLTRLPPRLGFALLCAAGAWGCGPSVDAGECSEGSACERGEACNLDEAVCEPVDLRTDTTEPMAGANFTNEVFPFFRGQVCTVTQTQAGAPFPVYLSPCLHPCLDVSRFEFKHSWTCTGSDCEAYAVMWMTGDGAGCPADAFGEFGRGQCQYTNPVNLTIDPSFPDGTAVEGSMMFEVPFLSNDDATSIAATNGSLEEIESRMRQYPQDPGRLIGRPIDISAMHPAPPADCGANGVNCECFEIGF